MTKFEKELVQLLRQIDDSDRECVLRLLTVLYHNEREKKEMAHTETAATNSDMPSKDFDRMLIFRALDKWTDNPGTAEYIAARDLAEEYCNQFDEKMPATLRCAFLSFAAGFAEGMSTAMELMEILEN